MTCVCAFVSVEREKSDLFWLFLQDSLACTTG
jgi:hypothetical protein